MMYTDGYDVQYYDRISNDGRTLRGAKVTDLQRGHTMNLGAFDTISECAAAVREWIYEQEKQHGGS